MRLCTLFVVFLATELAQSFQVSHLDSRKKRPMQLMGKDTSTRRSVDAVSGEISPTTSKSFDILKTVAPGVLSAILGGMLLLAPTMACADEIGQEVEAPTFFTGENIMVSRHSIDKLEEYT
jgi:hypothetical protein